MQKTNKKDVLKGTVEKINAKQGGDVVVPASQVSVKKVQTPAKIPGVNDDHRLLATGMVAQTDSGCQTRNLRADEIECKIATVKDKGVTVLLYKTARTDVLILDETYGKMGWKCKYREIKGNMYCGISVYDGEKNQWVTKWDCGVESTFGDRQKGEASDAFKRAGFKWGIGIELYTAPFIWIPAGKCNIQGGKCFDKFIVEKIAIKDKKITGLAVRNVTKNNERVFVWQETN